MQRYFYVEKEDTVGQYYKPTIIYPDGSVASFDAHAYGTGMKLTEHSWISNGLVNAVYTKIFNKPRRIAWIGDYSSDDYETCGESYAKNLKFEEFIQYYNLAWNDEGLRIPPSVCTPEELNLVNEDTEEIYLVNHDQKEYLDLGNYIERCTVQEGNWKGYCVNPLSLLTACGNGRGGGDFFQSESTIGYEHVGIWAFDMLELVDTIPAFYQECKYAFFEGNN